MNSPTYAEFALLNWEDIQPYYDQLVDVELTEDSLESWIEDWSDLRKLVDERYARLSLATALDMSDKDAEKDFHDFLEEVYSAVQAADQKLKEKILESGLIPARMEVALRKMRLEVDIFCEENLPLLTKESKLKTEYGKIFAAQTVQWGEDELTIDQAKTTMLTDDRGVRQELWELIAQRQLQDRNAINDLWKQFMEIRKTLVSNAGYQDYRSYRWQQRLRLDYTPEESQQFVDAIKDVVVPAATRVYQRHQKRLGIDQVRPWDLINNQGTFNLPALNAFETEEELITKTGDIFNHMDPILGEYFQTMQKEGLLDLMSRKNKRQGGFCTSFATVGLPYIFMNASGRVNDLGVLFHESGHAFHNFEKMKLPYHHQWKSGMEFNEVASTAMELLAQPYLSEDLGGFLSARDVAQSRILKLESRLLFWPYMAIVVAFQHWVYQNHELASIPDACDEEWRELVDKYMPGIDWAEHENVKETGWHRKLHIHTEPFYYIEYGLSALGAFQIWEIAQNDQKLALENYRKALALGGTETISKLYEAAGANLAFDAESLGRIINLIEETLLKLESELKH
jgi:oligoendopeptidase F